MNQLIERLNKSRLTIVILISLACVWLMLPTAAYFAKVAQYGSSPNEEQRADLNKRLENKSLIRLGLDLQGGASFLMSVDTTRYVQRGLESDVDSLRRQLRNEGVDATVELVKGRNEISFRLNDPKGVNFATDALNSLKGRFNLVGLDNIRDGAVRLVLNEDRMRREMADAFDGAMKVVNNRVDALGLTNPTVVRQGEDRILVQIPGQTDPRRVRENLLKAAVLEFRLLHPEHQSQIQKFIEPNTYNPQWGTGRIRKDLLEDVTDPMTGRTVKRIRSSVPDLPAGFTLRLAARKEFDKQTGRVVEDLSDLVLLVSERADLTGDKLVRAAAYTEPSSIEDPIQVSLEFNRQGARIFKDVTTANVGKQFAVLLDDVAYTWPNIREPIPNGRCVITGGFTLLEAQDLSTVLKAGALKAPLRPIEEMAIGPSLGLQSIIDSGKALTLGFVLLTIFMWVVYRQAGLIAIAAMTLNVLMILAFLSITGATLTLSGIGGLLLTMGMAVDANVLIYERLREELIDAGKAPRAAINGAFDRAFGVILDSNITSLLPALVLVGFEVVSGSVFGFWLTLAVGLVTNLYTGIFVTRALVEFEYERKKTINPGQFRIFKGINVDWMGPKWLRFGLIFSGVLTLLSVGYIATKGLNLGVDFTGGVVAQVRVPGETVEGLRGSLRQTFEDSKVVNIVGKEEKLVTVSGGRGHSNDPAKLGEELAAHLEKTYPGKAEIVSKQSIDPAIGAEFLVDAAWMVAITCLIIGGYLAFRFRLVFGVTAAIALLHDVFLSLGIFTLMGKPVTMDIVSALLIILGYSVNDTIVVFDRVREELRDHPMLPLSEAFNRGINLTMSRTIFTGATVVITLSLLFVFGGPSLSDFAMVLIMGILFGTYSSVFVAAALAYVWQRSRGEKTGADTTTGTPMAPKAATAQATTVGALR